MFQKKTLVKFSDMDSELVFLVKILEFILSINVVSNETNYTSSGEISDFKSGKLLSVAR
jgi:hypothetical protein